MPSNLVFGALLVMAGSTPAQPTSGTQAASDVSIVSLQGTVEIFREGKRPGVRTSLTGETLRAGDGLLVGTNSRVILRWTDQSVVSLGPLTEIEIRPVQAPSGLFLLRGILSFLHRDEPGRIRIITRGGTAGVRGTEFVMEIETVNNVERTKLFLIDGEVEYTNQVGRLVLTNDQSTTLEAGQAPLPSGVGFIANNVLQWAFYYPAVLDLRDLPLTATEEQSIATSLAAYRDGDLLRALAAYPTGRQPVSDAERIYWAGLLLSVGQVQPAEAALAALPAGEPSQQLRRLATALRQLIAAVKLQPSPATVEPRLPTELLAASYYVQSRALGDDSLKAALRLARQAAADSPEFGLAWTRVAELEFSFGRTRRALEALQKGLGLSPSNAQALALQGYLLAARNETRKALDSFEQALAIDSGLGNAWLGRGLCRLRKGDREGGREDLLVAAALEPQRALLRSYLGKAYANAGQSQRAFQELQRARQLDPADPTAWLYSALINREENRINPAASDLEKSIELNDNRAVYRSSLLLDQDRAVRSSSLAGIYRSANMNEVAAREAGRAVSDDYANYSSHLFLSESYNALRDPTRFNLRYETPWFSEWLLANLLSPVGGTPLSQQISQQEYSRLFEKDRLGLVSQTEYRSDGQVREVASQFGRYHNSAYAIDVDYQHNNGVRPNNELDRLELYTTFKQQLTPQDSVLLLAKLQQYHSGDNFQYYQPSSFRTNFYYNEYQSPGALFVGYHRDWTPGVHTLLLGGRLANDQREGDQNVTNYLVVRDPSGAVNQLAGAGVPWDVKYRSEFEIWGGELNQILQSERHTLVFGARYQSGTFDSSDQLQLSAGSLASPAVFPPTSTNVTERMERASGYAYWSWEVVPHLRLMPGLAYDWLRYPSQFRHPPLSPGESEADQLSPKGALTWSPMKELTVRGAYTRSLGGVSFDESYRLEPTQLAGFSQGFRTIMPEALVGSVSAPEFETIGAGLDLSFKSRTYVTLQGDVLNSEVRRTIGAFQYTLPAFPLVFTPSSLNERLSYDEQAASITINQLVSDEWSLGAHYRFAHSELKRTLPEVPTSVFGGARRFDDGNLHRAGAFALYNHPSGWFCSADLSWYIQNSSFSTNNGSRDVTTRIPGDEFPQLNLVGGYRLKRQRGELAIGGLNLTGEDYRLNPINLYAELPRERVFYVRLRLRF